jgi:hypothetical protein
MTRGGVPAWRGEMDVEVLCFRVRELALTLGFVESDA